MSRADEYRKYAADCIRVAQRSNNSDDKAMLVHMAQKWRELAEKVERQGDQEDSSEDRA
jgi:hypothetical protein